MPRHRDDPSAASARNLIGALPAMRLRGESRLVSIRGRFGVALSQATPLDVCAFLLPALSFLQVRVIGRLIIAELIALALLPWLVRARDRLHLPRWLLVVWAFWLVSQIATDVVVHSAFRDWARGWAAIAFTLIDLFAVATLVATPRRAILFAFGLAVAGVAGYVVNPLPGAATDPWKWAFAGPAGFILAGALSSHIAAKRQWLAVFAFATFGWLNAVFLFRALAGVSFVTAVCLAIALANSRLRRPERFKGRRLLSGIVGYGLVAAAVFLVVNIASSAGLFGSAARARFDTQSGVVPAGTVAPSASSNPAATPPAPTASIPVESVAPVLRGNPFAVLLGGRNELLASPWAILDSPIVGHGSWAKDPKYSLLQRQELDDLGLPDPDGLAEPNLIPTHSYLLGSWVWAGLGGGVFWLAIGGLALWLIANIYAARMAALPLVVFAVTWLLWDIAFSPYGSTARLVATFEIGVIFLGLRQLANSKAVNGAAGRNVKSPTHPFAGGPASSSDAGDAPEPRALVTARDSGKVPHDVTSVAPLRLAP